MRIIYTLSMFIIRLIQNIVNEFRGQRPLYMRYYEQSELHNRRAKRNFSWK